MLAPVVLVHNDAQYLSDAESALRRAGFDVAAISDAFIALEALETARRADLLITPLRMPEGMPNGVSLTLMAKRRRPGIKVLFLAQPEMAKYARDARAILVSEKPSMLELVTEVSRVVPGGCGPE